MPGIAMDRVVYIRNTSPHNAVRPFAEALLQRVLVHLQLVIAFHVHITVVTVVALHLDFKRVARVRTQQRVVVLLAVILGAMREWV